MIRNIRLSNNFTIFQLHNINQILMRHTCLTNIRLLRQNNVNSVIFGGDQIPDRAQTLELLLIEKDKRIEVLEEMNRMLRRELDLK